MLKVSVCTQIRRVLGWQIPFRRFFSWWCGGVSVGEAVFLLGFLAAIASRLEYSMSDDYTTLNAGIDSSMS